ncbi:MAG: hypothetical protein NC389_17670, partial [Acetatifactor muris]|nr:hypothetical protein [Acetatifactor muris]
MAVERLEILLTLISSRFFSFYRVSCILLYWLQPSKAILFSRIFNKKNLYEKTVPPTIYRYGFSQYSDQEITENFDFNISANSS